MDNLYMCYINKEDRELKKAEKLFYRRPIIN